MADSAPLNPISASFISARLSAGVLNGFPGNLPTSLREAYAIQNDSIRHWPDRVAGWKVGGIPPAYAQQFGENWLAGPIFSEAVAHQGSDVTIMAVFAGGFAAVEAEIVLRTDRSIAPGAVDPTSDGVFDLVPDAFIGVELASSPLAQINDLGPMSVISDFGNNAGLVIGDKIRDWPGTAIEGRRMSVIIDGEEVGASTISPLEKGAIGAFRFLLRNCTERGITLPAGTYISTGAVTGVHSCEAGVEAEINFEGTTTMRVVLVKAAPREKAIA